MSVITTSRSITSPNLLTRQSSLSESACRLLPLRPSPLWKSASRPQALAPSRWRGKAVVSSKPSSAELSAAEEEWLKRLPEKKKPLYSHSLPCIEAWLRSLGFHQSREDRAGWIVEKPHWHAQLSLDVTDLYIRYLKSGPGDLEKDVERRFSYALSREDIENAILGGP